MAETLSRGRGGMVRKASEDRAATRESGGRSVKSGRNRGMEKAPCAACMKEVRGFCSGGCREWWEFGEEI